MALTPDEQREAAQRVAAFTAGNDPNPGGRFPSGSYRTPDEARERGESWVARPGEPQDLRDLFHYQSPDEWRGAGRDPVQWGYQPSVMQGRATHAGWQGGRPAIDPGRPSLANLVMPVRQSVFGNLFQPPVSTTMPVDRRLASLLTY